MSTRHASAFRPALLGATFLLLILAAGAFAGTPFIHETVQKSNDVGWYSSLALDEKGRPHIAYFDNSALDLKYAFRDQGSWIVETVDAAGSVGLYCSIAVDAQGRPHISYQDVTNLNLKYAVKTAGSWSVQVLDSSKVVAVGTWTSIVIDANGEPAIAYRDVTNQRLKMAYRPFGFWTVANVPISNVGGHISLAVDSENIYHISYYDNSLGALSYVRRSSDVSQAAYTVDNTAGLVGYYTSIAVTKSGIPYISYQDVSNGDLKFAHRTGGTWLLETVDSAGSVGSYTSLALGEDGTAHVSYRDVIGRQLKYAQRSSDGTWTFETVNQQWFPGVWTSIALDKLGNPHISHYDDFLGDLKYAEASIHLLSPVGGETWPVGSLRTIEWLGAGVINILLSVDGGANYRTLATQVSADGDTRGGSYEVRVPHLPSRFCQVKVERAFPYSVSDSDSLFSIEADIVLLGLSVEPARELSGNRITWETKPGPEDLAGYRLDREREAGEVETLASLLRSTTYHDPSGLPGDRYILYGVNGLGDSQLLGDGEPEIALAPGEGLRIWPMPYRGGTLNISFATAGELGGGSAYTTVTIYDVAGRRVREVVRGDFPAGYRTTTWDGRDQRGRPVASGIYFVKSEDRLRTLATRKLVVVR